MPNPRFLQTAERWKNDDPPEIRVLSQKPKTQTFVPSGDGIDFSFLEGTEGERVFKEYRTRASRDYKNVAALNKLTFSDNVVKGSNPFSFVLLNKILREEGMWVARPTDLEKCLKEKALNLKDTYGDSGLVLRSDGEPNEYLARQLEIQVNQGGKLQYPVMVPLAGLDLEFDSNSPHSLGFKLTDSTELIYAPQLDHKNDYAKFNNADEKGLPIFDKKGSRTLYVEKGGLRRLYRDWDLDLGAGDGDLADDDGHGRVIVCREATRAKK
jgi:hypothetical protein